LQQQPNQEIVGTITREQSASRAELQNLPIPALIRRNTLYFALAQAMQGAGMQVAITVSALMVVALLDSPALAGVGGSILGISRLVAAYPTGRITDSFGRKPGMLAGLVMGLVGSLILALAMPLSSFLVFLIGMSLLGLGIGAVTQLRVAAADMYPPARRAEGLGWVLTGSVAGAFVGPLIIGAAALIAVRTEFDEFAIAWTLVPIGIVPAMVMVLLVRPDPKQIAIELWKYWPGYEAPVASQEVRTERRTGFGKFVADPKKQVAFAAYAAAQGTMAMMMVMTPLVMRNSGLSLTVISFAIALHVVGMFAFSVPMGRMADRLGRKRLIFAGLLIEAAGALLVPLTGIFVIITGGLFLVGFGWSAVNVAGTALIADTTEPDERGRAIGANDTFAAALAFGAPLAGGFIADSAGLMTVGVIGAVMVLVPFVMFTRLRESAPGQYEAEPLLPVASGR
jgi:MFS family permease